MRFDVVIIGGGHAGAEAAWVAARMGASTALVTMKREAIGRMSCNPAIGGIGKGQMVREVDALGGLMGLATDRTGIQFRMLNRRKGPAVWAPRAQCDREAYAVAVQEILSTAGNLAIVEGAVEELLVRSGAGSEGRPRIKGVRLADGREIDCDAVVVTTGTFLRALMHCGDRTSEGGRIGEDSATGLSRSLRGLGFELGRLKTGTPPRLHRDTIDYSRCEVQPGDDSPKPFSFLSGAIDRPQVPCWVTWTHSGVHERIRANLHRAPMYSGQIESRGPRYCPSIEDKVVRFAEKDRHQIFLEPEGYDSERIYCNGISTSLPQDVQEQLVGEIPGLESARILQFGYAVEYDFVPTDQTRPSLETKRVAGLFLAGQINGTSGYEEAAGQGIVAGINAVQLLRGCEPLILGRQEAYIGVMIDDLITRPPTEPYRMFTSRAEHRLRLRADNADERLTPVGRRFGSVDDERWEVWSAKRDALDSIKSAAASARIEGEPLSLWMRRPDSDPEQFAKIIGRRLRDEMPVELFEQVLLDARYAGYVSRQDQMIERFSRLESMLIPDRANYTAMVELRAEAREQLSRVAPRTLGQASRIPGITPADITVLWVYLSGRRQAR
jgi:tRNA uridine 5-carboxymethylaminomethyl modification enzyme